MSRTAKWILGCLIVLLLVCAVVSVGVVYFSRFNNPGWMMDFDKPRDWNPGRIHPWDDMPMRPNRLFPGRMLPGMLPFGGFFGILFCLGFVLLLVLSLGALVVSLTRSNKSAPAAVTASPPTPLTAVSEPEAPSRACPSCQRPVNDDWSHCPYCGTTLVPAE